MSLFEYVITSNIKACRWLESRWPNYFGNNENYVEDLRSEVDAALSGGAIRSVLEIGGIDRPLLSKSSSYSYAGLDIEKKPLCEEIYDRFFLQSIESPIGDKFDLLVSKEVIEHVPNNFESFSVMHSCLTQHGKMIHYIPSKFHFYSIILRCVGPRLQKLIIRKLRPHAVEVTGYPAFFNYCSPGQLTKLCKDVGFSRVTIRCYYRATDYFAFFVPLFLLVAFLENVFQRFNISIFSSGVLLVASK